jgi:putative transposase
MFGVIDIVEDKTHNGRKFRILNIIDEYSRECLLSFASRKITSSEVVEFLAELFCSRGLPEYIRLRQWKRIYCKEGKKVY